MVRPARIGLLVSSPTLADVRAAIELATSAWGGSYYPILDTEAGRDPIVRVAEVLAVDVLWPVSDSPAAIELSELPGFRWYGGVSGAPFSASDDSFTSRVLPTDWQIGHSHLALSLTSWHDDDPLAALFGTWFGKPASNDDRLTRALRFGSNAKVLRLDPEAPINPDPHWLTPTALTAANIDYTGDDPGVGIVIIDPADPADLLRFWNLRASGGTVVPWPMGHEDRVIPFIKRFIEDCKASGTLHEAHRGDGSSPHAYISIWARQPDDPDCPDALRELIEAFDIATWSGFEYEALRGWRGNHPLSTDFERSFDVEVDARAWRATIPLPQLPWPAGRHPGRWPGVVAAEVHIYGEHGLDPDRTCVVPRARRLAPLLRDRGETLEVFQRSNGDGGIFGVQAGDDTVNLAITHPLNILEALLDQPEWKFSQSDEGRFGTRLTELLGGAGTNAANQPAIREVLLQAARRSDVGLVFPALEQTAIRSRGEWPGLLGRRTPQDYARNLVLWLLERRLLRAALPLRCPSCRSALVIAPDDIAEDLTCNFCDHRFPLALAVAWLGSKSNWHYRIAGHVPEGRLRASLPSIAVTSALSTFGGFGGRRPTTMGMEVAAPGRKVEVDVSIISDLHRPAVVIGEVKSHHAIEAADIENLEWLQSTFSSQGVECFILFATLNKAFDHDEVALLRAYCERVPQLRRSGWTVGEEPLAMPIALTYDQLSVDQFSERHPFKWAAPGNGLLSAAIASCKHNLGLKEIETVWTDQDRRFVPVWNDDTTAGPNLTNST
jgi:hypothetical protein